MIVEEWRAAVDFEGFYEVSDMGGVRSVDRTIKRSDGHTQRFVGKVMQLAPDRNGYLNVDLCRNGVRKCMKVHRLVLEAFVGPCPEGMEALHGPGAKRDDNRRTNLSWGTRKQQYRDRVRDGSARVPPSKGEQHAQAKLNWVAVRAIRKDTRPVSELAAEYGVSPRTIRNVKAGQTWKE